MPETQDERVRQMTDRLAAGPPKAYARPAGSA